jgi:propanediol utilization protein
MKERNQRKIIVARRRVHFCDSDTQMLEVEKSARFYWCVDHLHKNARLMLFQVLLL